MSAQPDQNDVLAIDGGTPARTKPEPPMYPGGMQIDQEEEQAVLEVLRTKRLFRYYGPQAGPSKAEELEKDFAQFMGVTHALGVTSGTAALICALQGVGVGPGDEVIVPAFTWIASASAVAAVGGVPVVAEVDESLTLDPADVERKISPYTKAIMPVHMRGVPCRMDELLAVAKKHNLKVIEDTAQADGASYHGKRLGSMGDAGAFSFQFNKILTSGEGGMVLTNSDEVWKRAVMLHDVVGGLRNNLPEAEILWGINFRMPELLAAVMQVQLRRLDTLLTAMRQRKQMLTEGFQEIAHKKGVVLQQIPDPAGDASIAFIFLMKDAATAHQVSQALGAEKIEAWQLYQPDAVDYHIYAHWTPIMNQRTWTGASGPWRWARREIKYSKDMCPRSLDLLGRAVHLNVNPLFTNQDIEETLEGLNRVVKKLA
jgi:8-amino-3,8-dideoxy-alpha-D-manno-octulosonate transaminase